MKHGPLSVTRKIGVISPVAGSVRSSISGRPSSEAAVLSANCTEAIASRVVCVAVTRGVLRASAVHAGTPG